MLVESFGHVWRLSAKNYKLMLSELAAGREVDCNDLGTHLGVIDCWALVDVTPELAGEMLADLKSKKT
jgi:hypothetical protein